MDLQHIPELTFSSYKGGRFEYLLKEPFTHEIWEYLSKKENISKMISAIAENKPALWPHLEYIEQHFGKYITSEQFPDDDVEVMINNMILQIMNALGYEHIACGMLRHAKYIKLSGVYGVRK